MRGRTSRRAGLLLVDKEEGPTSHDVVQTARRVLDSRVGHTGTLDPFATGLLLLCVGDATRLAEYFHRLSKRYVATLRLGRETDTHDPRGEVTGRSEAWRELEEDDLRRALDRYTGTFRQRPPRYSAKKVGGRRAYEAARSDEAPRLEPVPVTVHELRLSEWDPPEARFSCRVSTGTYVRALARDVGRDLGCGAHLVRLRRTDVGPFSAEEAVPHRELAADGRIPDRAWRPPAEAVGWLPRRELDEEERERVSHGTPVGRGRVVAPRGTTDGGAEDGAPVALLHRGELVAVAEVREGRLQPRKVFDAA